MRPISFHHYAGLILIPFLTWFSHTHTHPYKQKNKYKHQHQHQHWTASKQTLLSSARKHILNEPFRLLMLIKIKQTLDGCLAGWLVFFISKKKKKRKQRKKRVFFFLHVICIVICPVICRNMQISITHQHYMQQQQTHQQEN